MVGSRRTGALCRYEVRQPRLAVGRSPIIVALAPLARGCATTGGNGRRQRNADP